MTVHEAELALAFALQSNPGAYAVLIGAGVSRSAGLPTAWEVQLDLINRIRQVQGVTTATDPVEWFRSEFGEEPEYDRLLDLVGVTPTERQTVLRDYFAPAAAPERPTPAHVALAKLVAAGVVRVVVTLNFDHLIEDALRQEQVEPTVVVTPEQFEAAAPLHAQRALVVHLHGDYTDGSSLLNTSQELQAYDPRTEQLLTQIVREYGLVIFGWSAKWDTALRAVLTETRNPHFSTWWYDPSPPSKNARQLVHARPAVHLPDAADAALPRLLDAVSAGRQRPIGFPTDPQMTVAGIRRRLALDPASVDVEDDLAALFDQLRHHPILTARDFNGVGESDPELLRRVQRFDADSAVLLAAVAATARARDSDQDWWLDGISSLTFDQLSAGSTDLIEVQNYPATLAWYSAGIALIAAKRFHAARHLTRDFTVLDREGHRKPANEVIAADKTLPWSNTSAHVFDTLQPIFLQALGLTRDAWERSWELFEYVVMVEQTAKHLTNDHYRHLAPLVNEAWVAQPEGTGYGAVQAVPAEAELREALDEVWASGVHGPPHLRTLGMAGAFRPRVSSAFRYELTRGTVHPLLEHRYLDPNVDRAQVRVAVVDHALIRLARDAAYDSTSRPGGIVVRNTGFWIDQPTEL